MFSTQIVPILKQNVPPDMQEEVSGPQAKILARLDLYLSQKREEDKKSGDSESLAALKSQLHEVYILYYVYVHFMHSTVLIICTVQSIVYVWITVIIFIYHMA